jgi:hypothetical protein
LRIYYEGLWGEMARAAEKLDGKRNRLPHMASKLLLCRKWRGRFRLLGDG